MRYYLYLLIVMFVQHTLVLEAQSDISVRRKEFKTDKPEFETAWKHVTMGDSYYKDKGIWYSFAFDQYLEAFIYNNSNAELNYKIGASALFSDKKEEAAEFLLKALELKSDVAADVLLLTGHALQYSGRFSEAIEKFNSYLNSPVKKSDKNISLARKQIEECKSALIITADTLRIAISNTGANINSDADDYSEIFSGDGKTLLFASRRKMPGSTNHYADSKFDENIFVSQLINDTWEPATIAGKKLTTKYCESPLYLNPTADMLYIYAGYKNSGDIMVSEKKDDVWQAPRQVQFGINSKASETSFTFSPSGNEIYFVSDKGKDNIGGKDIYYIKKVSDRKWSKPINAGTMINTVYDEESVRFSKTGDTLWFGSKGHNSIGGYDIFYSVRSQSGEWGAAKNAGYPVNTPWDDFFYYPSPTEDSTFYFVSNRNAGFGGLDIYKGKILPPEEKVVVKEVETPAIPPEPALFLIGKVTDSETEEAVIAKIDVIDIDSNLVVQTTVSNDVDGSYNVRLPGKKAYMIDVRATGFLAEVQRLEISESDTKEFHKMDVALTKVKIGKRVVLNNILFETGKSVLTTSSYAELDRLLKILLDNPLMKIEISGHTDITGGNAINIKLSGERAKAVVEYLIQKGIDKSRLESKGFGSQLPISDNATPEGRAKNRRVEFKILEF